MWGVILDWAALVVSLVYYSYRPLLLYLALHVLVLYLSFKFITRRFFPLSLTISPAKALLGLGFLFESFWVFFQLAVAPESWLSDPVGVFFTFHRAWLLALLPNLLLLFLLAAAGATLLKRWGVDLNNRLAEVLVGFALGYFLYTSAILVLLRFGLYTRTSLLLLLLVFFLVGLSQLSAFGRSFIGFRFRLERLSFEELILMLCLAMAITAAAVTNVRAIPIERDSFYTYLTSAQIVAVSERFLAYANETTIPYNFEIYLSSLIKVGGLPVADYASFVLGLLALGVALLVCRQLRLERTYTLFALGSAYLSPIFLTLTMTENKIDPALIFLSSVGLFCLIVYWQKPARRLLILLGIFLGLSYTVKMTATFYVVPIISLIFLKRVVFDRKLADGFILVASLALPVSLWWNTSTRIGQWGGLSWPPARAEVDLPSDQRAERACRERGLEFDLVKYLGGRSFRDELVRPVSLLTAGGVIDRRELSANELLLMTGLPFFFLMVIKGKRFLEVSLFLVTLLSFLVWYAIRREVLWYALPIFWFYYLVTWWLLNRLRFLESRAVLAKILILNFVTLTFFAVAVYAVGVSFVPSHWNLSQILTSRVFERANGGRPLSLDLVDFINQTYEGNKGARFFLADNNIALPGLLIRDFDRLVYGGDLTFFDTVTPVGEKITRLKTAGFTHLVFLKEKSRYVFGFYCQPDSFEKKVTFVRDSGLERVFEDDAFAVLKLN